MKIFTGKGVSTGTAVGTLSWYQREQFISDAAFAGAAQEWQRYMRAKEIAEAQIKILAEKAAEELGEEEAEIIRVQGMILNDPIFALNVKKSVEEDNMTAEMAVEEAARKFILLFGTIQDSYIRERKTDFLDIIGRVQAILNGKTESTLTLYEATILAADELLPSDILHFDKGKVAAFVTRKGTADSHAAILAKTMNIPTVVQADIAGLETYSGVQAAVDGEKGYIYIEPDEGQKEILRLKRKSWDISKMELEGLRGKEDRTKDGRSMKVLANIRGTEDIASAVAADAAGIGLFRTEFLFLGRSSYPDEEEQFQVYRNILEQMKGKPVIIRTLDVGADKAEPYLHLKPSVNPALGYRGIRFCLDNINIFKTQLRALHRAAVFGSLSVMFPMITSLEEVRKIKSIITQVKEVLIREELTFIDVTIGFMIETPAAALISDELAKEADFLSIGTNDLTQFVLAADRMDENVSEYYSPRHKAVMRLIEMTVENAKNAGIPVGICGELAGEEDLAGYFLRIGVDSLSVVPAKVLPLRKIIRAQGSQREKDM